MRILLFLRCGIIVFKTRCNHKQDRFVTVVYMEGLGFIP
jgi:hypothetical protein